jgi:hypothetical protein
VHPPALLLDLDLVSLNRQPSRGIVNPAGPTICGQMVDRGDCTLKVVVYFGWSPASMTASTVEVPEAHEMP